MFGIHFIKAAPTQYIIHFANGRKRHAGLGLVFFYYKPASSIVLVPIASVDLPFIFNEISQDFQALTVQGTLTYRIHDPELVASLLNYTVDGPAAHYVSEDPQKLGQRLINLLQVLVRAEVQRLPMRTVIHASESIASAVIEKFPGSDSLKALGVEVMALSIQGIRAIPEVACALETEAREELIRQGQQQEHHSSSGIIVSTGAGSTGWLSSVFNMTNGVLERFEQNADYLPPFRLEWGDEKLVYVVREPFVSKTSTADMVCGYITRDAPLVLHSEMPDAGVIFSDGVESDFLAFNAGAVATITLSKKRTQLVIASTTK